jgi:hypothetical protein
MGLVTVRTLFFYRRVGIAELLDIIPVGVALEADFSWLRPELLREPGCVGVVTGVTISLRNWAVHMRSCERGLIMAGVAHLGCRARELKTVARLVWIVAVRAASLVDRRVTIRLEHHVTTFVVAGEAQLLLFHGELKLVVFVSDTIVAHGAGADADRAVDPLRRAHGRVTVPANAAIILCPRPGDRYGQA